MPTARAFWARRMIESSTSAGATIIRSASSSITHSTYGSARLAAAGADAVELGQAARARERHHPVALLHLAHEVLERRRRLARRGDDRREQVRDGLVVVELDLLGVDQHHPDLVRRGAQEDRREHRVHAARLARAGRAGHEQVRHLREVRADRPARDVLAEPHRQRRPVRRRVLEDVAEVDDPPARVGDLDADRLLARDRREDADVGGGERVREVVLELGDLRDLDAGREAQLVAGDVRARDHPDHPRLHAEVPERLHELRGDLLLARGVRPARLAAGALEEARVGDRPRELRRVGDRRPQAALRREVGRLDRAQHPRLVLLGVLRQARRLGLRLRLGLRRSGSSSGGGSSGAGGSA